MAFAKTLPAAWFALGLAAAVLPAHRHSAVGRMVDPRTYPSEKNRVQTLMRERTARGTVEADLVIGKKEWSRP
jgi:hypothetical protein